jgi:hypothetical protein
LTRRDVAACIRARERRRRPSGPGERPRDLLWYLSACYGGCGCSLAVLVVVVEVGPRGAVDRAEENASEGESGACRARASDPLEGVWTYACASGR